MESHRHMLTRFLYRVGVLSHRFHFIFLFQLASGMAEFKAADRSEALFSDGEKNSTSFSQITIETTSQEIQQRFFPRFVRWMTSWGIETNGYVTDSYTRLLVIVIYHLIFRITPVPPEERTDTRLYQIFFVWFTANANILTCVPPE